MLKTKNQSVLGLPILLIAVMSLAGCSKNSEPKTQYYVFDTLPEPAQINQSMQLVEVRPIQLPNYLEQRNLVMRDGSAKLLVSQHHLWADDPEASITRELINSLNRRSASRHYQPKCNDCAGVRVVIEHFYPTLEGDVVLSGEYSFDDDNDFDSPFSFNGTLERDGYEEAVRVMRNLIGELAQQIDNQKTIPSPVVNDG